MKIIYFHQHFSTPAGSAGIRSYQMAKTAIEHGHEILMVCGSHGSGVRGLTGPFHRGVRRGMVDGIEVVEFNLEYSNSDGFVKRSVTFLRFAWASLRLALTEKYDLIFATSTPLTAAVPGIAARWLRQKPFVFEVRDLWPELPRAMGAIQNPLVLFLLRCLEWTAYKSADRIVGLSPGIVEGIRKGGGADKPIAHIPNGCDLEIFADSDEMWSLEGAGTTDLVAVFSGTHGMANGLGAVLDAAAELKRRKQTRVKIVLVGQGSQKSNLKQRAESEGIDNVIFLDPVNKARLAGLMKRADIGIQCLANVPAFYYGTSPNKFFDYIAAGLPVLNNYPGWLATLISEHDCGIVVVPDQPVAFADALERFIDNRQELRNKGKRARLLAEDQFNRKALALAWLAFTVRGTADSANVQEADEIGTV